MRNAATPLCRKGESFFSQVRIGLGVVVYLYVCFYLINVKNLFLMWSNMRYYSTVKFTGFLDKKPSYFKARLS